MKLSKTEELLMTHLWDLEEAFLKDLIDQYEEPKPANTTIATLLKRMQDKEFVAFTMEGRSRKYYPVVTKDAYLSRKLKGIVHNFFGDSATQFASFFTNSTDMSKDELESLRKMIDNQIAKK